MSSNPTRDADYERVRKKRAYLKMKAKADEYDRLVATGHIKAEHSPRLDDNFEDELAGCSRVANRIAIVLTIIFMSFWTALIVSLSTHFPSPTFPIQVSIFLALVWALLWLLYWLGHKLYWVAVSIVWAGLTLAGIVAIFNRAQFMSYFDTLIRGLGY